MKIAIAHRNIRSHGSKNLRHSHTSVEGFFLLHRVGCSALLGKEAVNRERPLDGARALKARLETRRIPPRLGDTKRADPVRGTVRLAVIRRRAGAAGRSDRGLPAAARWRGLTGLLFCLGLVTAPGAEIRWSLSSNRIYLTGSGAVTLSNISAAQDQAPLEQVAPGVWQLRANLIVQDGAQLVLHGTAIGGDVDQLRLQSNNSTDTNRFVFISADWGSISIQNTSIASWDDAVGGPDTEYEIYGRAFINVRSQMAADGVTALESRMDIKNSDIGYLGYDEPEAYGLSWKVVGAGSGLFDRVGVFGDIVGSHIHHNYFGVYTFGAEAMQWLDNEIAHNVQYGFDAHDDSDHLLIQGNNAHHNGNHGIILHRSSDDSLLEGNQCLNNGDTGIVLTGGWRCIVRSNLLAGNFEAGIRLNLGSADNLIEGNVCASNTWYGFYLYKGADAPEPNDDGRPKRNQFVSNLVQGNLKAAINLADSDDNTFATNTFQANGDTLHFERGFGNRLVGNSIPAEVIVRTIGSPADAPSTYVSHQPSLRVQVDAYSSTIFEDGNGQIFDPEEDGVATLVTTNGSTLTLTAKNIGTTSTVVTRNLWVEATEGGVWIDPTSWTAPDGLNKQWIANADSAGTTFGYTVGHLGSNRPYVVLKAGLVLMSVNSDSAGRITFTDRISTTNKVQYAIQPDYGVSVEKVADELVVSWKGGTLQRSVTLSPANWENMALSNNQVRIPIALAEPMEFFRFVPVPAVEPGQPPVAGF